MICPDHTIENSRAGSWLYLETLVFLGLTLYHADVQLPMGRGSDNSDVPIQLCGSLVSNIPWYSPIFIGRKILVEECLEQQLASQWRWPSGKNLPANAGDAGDVGSIPGSGRSPEGGHGNPLQYSWRFPWTEDPGRIQSMESQKVGQDWVAEHTGMHACTHSMSPKCFHACLSPMLEPTLCFCFHNKKSLWRICISATEVENEKKKLRKEISVL